ncbi:chorion peroxidase [Patella vulgata]|uniref:chorion peroxidase n=1 Tax=Patella vulgata TaxID=6465 RepID=UPI00217F9469|nr:chorion peroxidase [Patella vulgata]
MLGSVVQARHKNRDNDYVMSLTMYQAQLSAMKRDYKQRETTVEISTIGPRSFNQFFGFGGFAGDAADADFDGGADTDFDSPCPDSDRLYRNITGYCNNIRRPTQGKSFERYKRYVYPQYQDGICLPRIRSTQGFGFPYDIHFPKGGYKRKESLGSGKRFFDYWWDWYKTLLDKPLLPSARTVSVVVHPAKNVNSRSTVMLMQWGQFLDHDLTAAAIEQPDTQTPCCEDIQENGLHPDVSSCSGQCFPIPIVQIPPDRFFKRNCIEFLRSRSVEEKIDEENPREQQNLLTAFVDGSSVYGSDEETEERLRGEDGRMKVSDNNLLPKGNSKDCIEEDNFCFAAGDDRVHVFPGLTALHTTFVRLHNTIVQKLDDNTDWDDERLYQETRKIVGAILQRITYLEFLPEIFNKRTLRKYKLKDGNYKYNINIDPSIASVFATAAFRFGHSLIPNFLVIDGEKVLSRKLFNNPKFVFEKLKALVKSVLSNPSETVDRFLTEEITDHLFEVDDLSFDLASFNIQRGRDHGLPPYNAFRKLCKLRRVKSFYSRQLGSAGPDMAKIYRSVDDIDVFAGGLAEPPLRGSQLGPTFTCILAQQFKDLKFGDSFWHETKDRKRGFTSDQLESLKRVTLSKVLCDEIGLDSIQRNPFRTVTDGNPEVSCDSLPDLDLSPWWDDETNYNNHHGKHGYY